jgi:hypothetical protein
VQLPLAGPDHGCTRGKTPAVPPPRHHAGSGAAQPAAAVPMAVLAQMGLCLAHTDVQPRGQPTPQPVSVWTCHVASDQPPAAADGHLCSRQTFGVWPLPCRALNAPPPQARPMEQPELSSDPDNIPPRSRLFLVVPKQADPHQLNVRGDASVVVIARGVVSGLPLGGLRGLNLTRLAPQDAMAAYDGLEYCKTDLVAAKGVVFCKFTKASAALQALEDVTLRGTVSCAVSAVPVEGWRPPLLDPRMPALTLCVCRRLAAADPQPGRRSQATRSSACWPSPRPSAGAQMARPKTCRRSPQ